MGWSYLAGLRHGESDERALAVALRGTAALPTAEHLQGLHRSRRPQAPVVRVVVVGLIVVPLVLLDGVWGRRVSKGPIILWGGGSRAEGEGAGEKKTHHPRRGPRRPATSSG